MSIIFTSTYPQGQHWKLDPMDIVQVRKIISGTYRLRDCRVHELSYGDEYNILEKAEEPVKEPRTGDEILAWMEGNCIEPQYIFDVDGKPEAIALWNDKGSKLTPERPYEKGCLREAAEFVMDQENV